MPAGGAGSSPRPFDRPWPRSYNRAMHSPVSVPRLGATPHGARRVGTERRHGHMSRTNAASVPTCHAAGLGLVGYREAWELQRGLADRVAAGSDCETLLLLEHPHVYTLGRRGKAEDILAPEKALRMMGAEVHHVDRGGEVTYHGPGQLVGYPILRLRRWFDGPLAYVRALEGVIVGALGDFGIRAQSGDRPTGVWVGDAKIAAIGVKVSRGVTTHGFALNVAPDLSFFEHIVPCGMRDARVTSMSALLGRKVAVDAVIPVVARHFETVCGWRTRWLAPAALLQRGPARAGLEGAIGW